MSISGGKAAPLLSVEGVVPSVLTRQGRSGVSAIYARDGAGITLEIAAGEILALVGESGTGKSTFARNLFQMPRPCSGRVRVCGHDLTRLRGRALVEKRKPMQMVFQDPFASVNPCWSVFFIIEEPLLGSGATPANDRARIVDEALEQVGLDPDRYRARKPHELSGGECQRVAIARALAPGPGLLVCDEAVASLDVLVQAQIIRLFLALRQQLGLALLFISHDLATVGQLSDRVAVLSAGCICETGPTGRIFRDPRHPYTQRLLSASFPERRR